MLRSSVGQIERGLSVAAVLAVFIAFALIVWKNLPASTVRDFGSFAGLTPTAWAATQGNAGFLQDGAIATL